MGRERKSERFPKLWFCRGRELLLLSCCLSLSLSFHPSRIHWEGPFSISSFSLFFLSFPPPPSTLYRGRKRRLKERTKIERRFAAQITGACLVALWASGKYCEQSKWRTWRQGNNPKDIYEEVKVWFVDNQLSFISGTVCLKLKKKKLAKMLTTVQIENFVIHQNHYLSHLFIFIYIIMFIALFFSMSRNKRRRANLL